MIHKINVESIFEAQIKNEKHYIVYTHIEISSCSDVINQIKIVGFCCKLFIL